MSQWTDAIVESMSTLELGSALRDIEEGNLDKPPSRQLVERMSEEWDQRPVSDRIAAERQLEKSQG